jgi:ribosomal protein L18E
MYVVVFNININYKKGGNKKTAEILRSVVKRLTLRRLTYLQLYVKDINNTITKAR